jgi:hypothetical protein
MGWGGESHFSSVFCFVLEVGKHGWNGSFYVSFLSEQMFDFCLDSLQNISLLLSRLFSFELFDVLRA